MEYEANATLVERVDLSDELAIFKIKPDGGTVPQFAPGQYAELAIVPAGAAAAEGRKLERRSYSIASSPRADGYLEFYIVRVIDGLVTPLLWDLKSGDRLWLGPKIKGKFTLADVPEGKDLIMVATGTGLAPFMSMLRHHHDNPPWRRALVVHGARYLRDLGYRDEFEQFARKYPWFGYVPTLTREESAEWKGSRGRVQQILLDGPVEEWLGAPLNEEYSHILLCGNPQMIEDVETLLLEKRGLRPHKKKTPGNIHVERYW